MKKRWIKILIVFTLIILVFFYGKVFFTSGMYIENTFLEKEIRQGATHYIGKHDEGDIHIVVNGMKNSSESVTVTYSLPNQIKKEFEVYFNDKANWNDGIYKITETGKTVFEGKYIKGNPFLYNKKGEPIVERLSSVHFKNEPVFKMGYSVTYIHVAKVASYHAETVRGNFETFFIALFFGVFIAIDIRFPKFFFMIRHWLSVDNPEPSDLYIFIQTIGWYIYPVISFILFIIAMFGISISDLLNKSSF